jgi:hypothetical protein
VADEEAEVAAPDRLVDESRGAGDDEDESKEREHGGLRVGRGAGCGMPGCGERVVWNGLRKDRAPHPTSRSTLYAQGSTIALKLSRGLLRYIRRYIEISIDISAAYRLASNIESK